MVQTDGMQEMDQDEAQAASLQTPLFPLDYKSARNKMTELHCKTVGDEDAWKICREWGQL